MARKRKQFVKKRKTYRFKKTPFSEKIVKIKVTTELPISMVALTTQIRFGYLPLSAPLPDYDYSIMRLITESPSFQIFNSYNYSTNTQSSASFDQFRVRKIVTTFTPIPLSTHYLWNFSLSYLPDYTQRQFVEDVTNGTVGPYSKYFYPSVNNSYPVAQRKLIITPRRMYETTAGWGCINNWIKMSNSWGNVGGVFMLFNPVRSSYATNTYKSIYGLNGATPANNTCLGVMQFDFYIELTRLT